MIKSMTGFGKAEATFSGKKLTVEARALNSKQLDLSIRIPAVYRSKEIDLRNDLTKLLERGKVEVYINIEAPAGESSYSLNQELALNHLKDIKSLSRKIGNTTEDFLPLLMRLPDVMKQQRDELDNKEWKLIHTTTKKAITELNEFRQKEGKQLQLDLHKRLSEITKGLAKIEKLDGKRIASIKKRISGNLKAYINPKEIDMNRFEQELIYYIEKLDISEEKVRLTAHLKHFQDTMNGKKSQGKKLGFITQELGREINTIGSKSNDATMQQTVVQMKDDLEKIKEQVLNIL